MHPDPDATTTTTTEPAKHGPLHGVRVLDISTVYAAPITAMMLGDFGADVLKLRSSTRAGAPLSRSVVQVVRRPRTTPSMPARRISRATRSRPQP